MNSAISVERISKRYRINRTVGVGKAKYRTLGESVMHALAAPLRNLRSGAALGEVEDFWAVRDVSFEVEPGQVLGIIGRNGAGKSTLLKILTRITDPTEGRATLRGRVGSLLEVGTGFHPELSGREDFFLNGSILGMSRMEIKSKLEEIVEFSGIAKFIDTPVKRYSSGMKVRLAFAVAAHLDLEVMLIDEVLAVGDADFQKKCLGRMSDVASSGRTILFVSHNMAAVQNLCQRVIVVKDGKKEFDGQPGEAIQKYLQQFEPDSNDDGLSSVKRDFGYQPIIQGIEFFDAHGTQTSTIPSCTSLTIRISYDHPEETSDRNLGMAFENSLGVKMFGVQSRIQRGELPNMPSKGTVTCRIPSLPLMPGIYYIMVGYRSQGKQLDVVQRAGQITVIENDVFGTGKLPDSKLGSFVVKAEWLTEDEARQ